MRRGWRSDQLFVVKVHFVEEGVEVRITEFVHAAIIGVDDDNAVVGPIGVGVRAGHGCIEAIGEGYACVGTTVDEGNASPVSGPMTSVQTPCDITVTPSSIQST